MTAADRPSVTDNARDVEPMAWCPGCGDCILARVVRERGVCSNCYGTTDDPWATARAETTTEWAHMLVGGGASIHRSREAAEQAQRDYLHQQANLYPVDDPPGPPSAGIYRREVTEWKKADQ